MSLASCRQIVSQAPQYSRFYLQPHWPIWTSPMGKSGCFLREKPVATGSCYHNPPNSDVDHRIFNLRTGVNACVCTGKFMYGHRKRVCTESRLWEKNPLPYRGIEPTSAACRSNWATSPTHLPRRKLLVVTASPARSFPLTLACPRQYNHRSLRRWKSHIDTCQLGPPIPFVNFFF